jgi:hypothetical protein
MVPRRSNERALTPRRSATLVSAGTRTSTTADSAAPQVLDLHGRRRLDGIRAWLPREKTPGMCVAMRQLDKHTRPSNTHERMMR